MAETQLTLTSAIIELFESGEVSELPFMSNSVFDVADGWTAKTIHQSDMRQVMVGYGVEGYAVPCHNHKQTEYLFVMTGEFEVKTGDTKEAACSNEKPRTIGRGETAHFPPLLWHEVRAVGKGDNILLAIQEPPLSRTA